MTCACLCGCKRPLGQSWATIPMHADMRWGPVVNAYVVTVTVCAACAEEMQDARPFLEVVQ